MALSVCINIEIIGDILYTLLHLFRNTITFSCSGVLFSLHNVLLSIYLSIIHNIYFIRATWINIGSTRIH